MDCLQLVIIAILVYLIFVRKEGMVSSGSKFAKGAYTSSLVDRDAIRRSFTSIDDTNANPIVVDCAPDKTGCRYIDAPKNFVRWSSQI